MIEPGYCGPVVVETGEGHRWLEAVRRRRQWLRRGI